MLIGAKSLKVTRPQATGLCKSFLDAYATALTDGKARWAERETADGMVLELLKSVQNRPRAEFLDSRTERLGKKRSIRLDGRKALPASDKQRKKISGFMQEFANTQPNPRFYKTIDIARRIAGNGSLGVDRYMILVEGKGSPDGNYLLDLKESLPSALAPHLKAKQPRWATEAHRIVAIQRRVQATPMAFLQPVSIGRVPYVLRELQPSENRVALDRWNKQLDRLEGVLRTMGEVVAWGQLRSSGRDGSAIADELIDFGERQKWKSELLETAEHCAELVGKDWNTYVTAFDEGAFKG